MEEPLTSETRAFYVHRVLGMNLSLTSGIARLVEASRRVYYAMFDHEHPLVLCEIDDELSLRIAEGKAVPQSVSEYADAMDSA